MILQRTLKGEIKLEGIGVHSGRTVRLTLRPAPPFHGIVFARTDLEGSPTLPANYKNIVNTQMATTLGVGGVTLSTVEHLLAALQGMEVDNAWIGVDGPEVPIMDGSSLVFCKAIERVGVESQLQPRPYLVLKRKVELKLSEKWAVAEPAQRLEIFGSIEWDHPSIGYQEYHYIEGRTPFQELASARTFGFLKEVESLRKLGLARGGSLDNAVILDHALVLNPEGLRCPDEFVKHKVLDALGDFKLAGHAIHAYVRLHRAGHDLHRMLIAEILKSTDNYEIVHSMDRQPIRNLVTAPLRPVAAGI
ncbi:MAG: UDP-3-O-acyl-N-acetylglucosamine deacetylase [Bdellovibrio sp.]|nr:UDP-3-O-acyl-N-acetylglucosamine deacetylase [Bdellovibrio sp.]